MKDHYKEYMEAGVMPGNLGNDRLLTDDELCPNIAETGALEKQDAKTSRWLVEKFNQWADEIISDLNSLSPLSHEHSIKICNRIDTYQWAKQKLERLSRGIKG